MNQKYSDISNYFKDLCDQHKEINEFNCFELDELLSNAVLNKFPAFVLEGNDYNFSGSTPDNVIKNRNGAFCIVEKCDINNTKKRMDALDHLDTIAEQFLTRMLNDKKRRHPLLTTFEIASAEGLHFANPALGIVFCRVNFIFKTKIVEDLSAWE